MLCVTIIAWIVARRWIIFGPIFGPKIFFQSIIYGLWPDNGVFHESDFEPQVYLNFGRQCIFWVLFSEPKTTIPIAVDVKCSFAD